MAAGWCALAGRQGRLCQRGMAGRPLGLPAASGVAAGGVGEGARSVGRCGSNQLQAPTTLNSNTPDSSDSMRTPWPRPKRLLPRPRPNARKAVKKRQQLGLDSQRCRQTDKGQHPEANADTPNPEGQPSQARGSKGREADGRAVGLGPLVSRRRCGSGLSVMVRQRSGFDGAGRRTGRGAGEF